MSRSALRDTVLRWLRRLGPWVVACGLLLWVFSRVPLDAFGRALARGQFSWFLPTMLLCMVAIYLADCLAISKTFTWFTAKLRYREVLAIRGASYLLSVINYNLGQGAIILFVKRAKGVHLGLGTGTVLLIMGINLVVLLLLASAALGGADVPRAASLWPWIIGLLSGFAVYLVILVVRPAFLARYEIFMPAFRAGLRGHAAALVVRLPHLGLIFLAHYLAMRAFGIHPPVGVFLAYMPLVSLISALPISPQGLGTQQVAAVYFFAPYASGDAATQEATALAYSLTIAVMAVLFMLGMGLLWFRTGMRMLGLREADPTGQAS